MKETFSNTNLDSVGEISPKVQICNNEIAKFIQEIKRKHSITLDYTVLEISDVPHWAETFHVLARLNTQPEVQLTQVPVPGPAEMPNFSVPPLSADMGINHQQAEINRLTYVAQQWLKEAPQQYNQALTQYNHDRMNANTGRGRSF